MRLAQRFHAFQAMARRPPVVMKNLVLDIVERVTIAANRIDIWLNRAKIAAALEAGGGSQRPDIDSITLSIEAKLRRAGKGKPRHRELRRG
jgi:hypothetical protein